jgi:hypothetical protein
MTTDEVWNGPIRFMLLQLIGPEVASADGEDAGINSFPTSDVVGGVSDDQKLLPLERDFQVITTLSMGELCDLITVFMLVRKSADGKTIPELVVAKFDFGPQGDVAGEEAYYRLVRKPRELVQKREDAFAWAARENA